MPLPPNSARPPPLPPRALLLQGGPDAPLTPDVVAAARRQKSGSIPVLVRLTPATLDAASRDLLADMAAAGLDGISVSMQALAAAAGALTGAAPDAALPPADAASAVLRWLGGQPPEPASQSQPAAVTALPGDPTAPTAVSAGAEDVATQHAQQGRPHLLTPSREQLMADERRLIMEVLAFLEATCPALQVSMGVWL